jgi:hypothetical protein
MKATDMDQVTAFAHDVVHLRRRDVGLFELTACRRHLDDLASGRQAAVEFSPARALYGIRFLQFARAGFPERLAKTPIEPTWEIFVVGSIFGWLRSDGGRCHTGKNGARDLLSYALREGIVTAKNMVDFDNRHLLREGPAGA